jgi:hypothetical protein
MCQGIIIPCHFSFRKERVGEGEGTRENILEKVSEKINVYFSLILLEETETHSI